MIVANIIMSKRCNFKMLKLADNQAAKTTKLNLFYEANDHFILLA